MSQSAGDSIIGDITGDVSGQLALGKDIAQTQTVGAAAELSEAERAELSELLADLRARVAAEAPPDEQQAAIERATELEEALRAEKPDMTTVQYVKGWFVKRLPALAGLITGVLVHPVVGKLVQNAGDVAVAQLNEAAEQ
jgi:hypothetical protein